jgi:PhnB protein
MASSMPPEAHGRVMHATLQVGDQVLQGAEAPPGQFTKPAGFCVAVDFDDPAEGERVFSALARNGKVHRPFQLTFWAKGSACSSIGSTSHGSTSGTVIGG